MKNGIKSLTVAASFVFGAVAGVSDAQAVDISIKTERQIISAETNKRFVYMPAAKGYNQGKNFLACTSDGHEAEGQIGILANFDDLLSTNRTPITLTRMDNKAEDAMSAVKQHFEGAISKFMWVESRKAEEDMADDLSRASKALSKEVGFEVKISANVGDVSWSASPHCPK